MSKPWRLLDAAERELDAACTWYDEQRAGLGAELADVVSDAIAALARMPTTVSTLASPVIQSVTSKSAVRRHRIARFPYAIIFVELEHEVVVVAVAHLRQRPNYWAKRLRAT